MQRNLLNGITKVSLKVYNKKLRYKKHEGISADKGLTVASDQILIIQYLVPEYSYKSNRQVTGIDR